MVEKQLSNAQEVMIKSALGPLADAAMQNQNDGGKKEAQIVKEIIH